MTIVPAVLLTAGAPLPPAIELPLAIGLIELPLAIGLFELPLAAGCPEPPLPHAPSSRTQVRAASAAHSRP
ncbi:MAG TPA: hypothetical protein VGM12_27875 [Trebonia sp.]